MGFDVERGTYVAPTLNGNANTLNISKSLDTHDENTAHQTAGFCGYAFQILFQVWFSLQSSQVKWNVHLQQTLYWLKEEYRIEVVIFSDESGL